MIPSMRHGLAGGLLLLCSLAFPGGSYCQEPPYIYRFGVKVEMVSIFATVLDRAGRLVTGLNRDDFAVYDNGERQAISQFSREYIPVSVVILLDTSSSMLSGKKLDNAKKALAQFLKRLHKGDEALLMTFRTRPRIFRASIRGVSAHDRQLYNGCEVGGLHLPSGQGRRDTGHGAL